MKQHKGQYSAFPFPGFIGAEDIKPQRPSSGLLARDYIALKAMSAFISSGDQCPAIDVASYAYAVADSMLDAREK